LAGPRDPNGDDWDFEDDEENERRLPNLYAKFGGAA
jgi:hypothetical protein